MLLLSLWGFNYPGVGGLFDDSRAPDTDAK
jgi:hypothetical protein